MIVAFLLMSAILMMSIQTSMATEKDIMSNDVIKQAFDNNVNKISCIPETKTISLPWYMDMRRCSYVNEKEIIKPQSAKASYDYYKTYRTGVSGAYGATGYSKPSVTVSSWSANKMKFKGTWNLQLGEHILWQELRLYRYHDIWLWGGVHMSTKNNKLRFIDEEKTKELQKDWKGYGKSQVLFGIVVFVIFVLSALYYYIL